MYLPYPHLLHLAIPNTPKEPRYYNVLHLIAEVVEYHLQGNKNEHPRYTFCKHPFFSSMIERHLAAQASCLDLQVVRPRSAAGAAAGSAGRSLVHNG